MGLLLPLPSGLSVFQMIFLYICKIPRQSSSIFHDGSGRTGKQERWPIISYQTLERFEFDNQERFYFQVAALTMDLNLGIISEGEKRLKKKLILDYIYSNLRFITWKSLSEYIHFLFLSCCFIKASLYILHFHQEILN